MLLPTLLTAPPAVWYGPKTVAFNLETSGNPYDPVQNDVQVEFRGPGGATERRLAYFDGDGWKATLLSHTKGEFRPTVFYNGAKGVALAPVALTTIKPFGFVRLGGKTNFRLDDGTAYWPLGHNLAWANGNEDLTADLKRMGADGLNWSRIWANHWDGKNPFWKEGETPKAIGTMIPSVLDKWDAIVDAADASGVRFQMTLFHHGPWSTRVNTNWPENPWNVKNKGFLKTPSEFFTNPRAKALAKAWLRYAVARWGHSPSVMAWELFNEVQWCDPHYVKGGDAILGAWHDEMADYLRSIDPYHHLITTSSDLDLPIYKRVDYYQPHTYPPSVEGAVAAAPTLDKPLFFGEFGPGQLDGSRPVQVEAIRDGIWTGLLSLQAGAGQYWSWDLIPKMNLEPEFVRAARLMREVGADHTGFRIAPVTLDAGTGGDFTGQPGGGWETSKQFAFRLPEDGPNLGRLSSFLQGQAHPEMQPQPVTLTFMNATPSTVSVEMTGVSDSGGKLILNVDGNPGGVLDRGAGTKITQPARLSATVQPGSHTITLRNDGPDWVQLGRITVTGIAPRATARAITDGKRAVLRIKGKNGTSVALDGLGLEDGRYRAHVANLDGGDVTVPILVKGGRGGRIALPGADTVVIVRQ